MPQASFAFTAIAMTLYCLIDPTIAHDTVNYVISVIEHLSASDPGVPTCVFFGLTPDHPFEDVSEHVIQSPRLAHVTKYVVSGAKNINYLLLPNNPTVMVVDVGGLFSSGTDFDQKKIAHPFMSADPTSKLLVLFDTEYDLERIMPLCNFLSFTNVVYLDVTNHLLTRGNGLVVEQLPVLPHPENLFYKALRNITGRRIVFSAPVVSSFIPSVKWTIETTRFLNTVAYGYHASFENTDIWLKMRKLRSFTQENAKCFNVWFPATVETSVVLIPRDLLNIMEIFFWPFDWQVWLVVAFVLILSEVVKFFLPAVFKNDPVLLAVCGFEKHDLHKAGRWEKLIFHSLMVFVFFTTCAYETKIISLMINRPPSSQIGTIDELAKSNIKILAHESGPPRIANDSRYSGMFIMKDIDSGKELDGIHGYTMNREAAEFLAPTYYDEELRRSKYTILEEPIEMLVDAYQFSPRNPLLKTFEYTYQVFTESGLMQYWSQMFYRKSFYILSKKYSGFRTNSDNEILEFPDMLVAWIALAIGAAISVCGFVLEIAYHIYSRDRFVIINVATCG